MNCDADKLAEKFWKLMDEGTVKALKEGFFIDLMEVGISVDGVKVTSHILHQIRLKIQGEKHRSICRRSMIGMTSHGIVSIGRGSSLASYRSVP
jgi:hypothetical protein